MITKANWTFQRLGGSSNRSQRGHVEICTPDGVHITLDEQDWIDIVASVSASGNIQLTRVIVETLHNS